MKNWGSKMKKSLSQYLKLNYPIEILKIPDRLGGGYTACIPQLGRNAFIGDGETREEALEDLGKTKKDIFADYLKKGIPIPEPIIEEDMPSGRLVLRMPINLHAKLAEAAKSNKVSLNHYIVSLLSENYSIERVTKKVGELIKPVSEIHINMQAPEGEREIETMTDESPLIVSNVTQQETKEIFQ